MIASPSSRQPVWLHNDFDQAANEMRINRRRALLDLYRSRPSPRFRASSGSLPHLKKALLTASRRQIRIPVPNLGREPNRCNLEPFKLEMPKITPYLVLAQGRLTLQVVCLGLAHFRLPVRPPKSLPGGYTRESPAGHAGTVWMVDRARRPGGVGFSPPPAGRH